MPKCDLYKVAGKFIEIALRHGCCSVDLMHIFRTPFSENTTGWLLLAKVLQVKTAGFVKYYQSMKLFIISKYMKQTFHVDCS